MLNKLINSKSDYSTEKSKVLDSQAFTSQLNSFFEQGIEDVNDYLKYSSRFTVEKQRRFLVTFQRLLSTLQPVKAIYLMREVATGVELEVLNDINNSLQSGGKISDGCDKWFSSFVVQGLALGEQNNSLKEAVAAAIENMAFSGTSLFSTFVRILYPVVLTFSGMGLISYLGSSLLPLLLNKLSKLKEVPFEMTLFKSIAFFYDNILLYVFMFLFVSFMGLYFYLKNGVGERRSNLDQYFPFYEYRQIKSILFMRMFAMLKKYKMSDLAILSSLAKNEKDLYMLSHINKMIKGIQSGHSMGVAIDTGLINRADILTLKVLTESQEGMFVEAMEGTIKGAVEAIKYRLEFIANVVRYFFMATGFVILGDMAIVVFSVEKYIK